MKKEFSTSWKSSKKKRKQRKYRFNAPLHIKNKFLSANLNKELRKKYSVRSLPVRKGDLVKIMKGKFRGKTGKVESVDVKNLKVSVEGMQRQKKAGAKINVYFDSSNLQIQELNLEDKEREKILLRKKAEKKI